MGILDDDDFRTVLFERGTDGCEGDGSWNMILEVLLVGWLLL